MGPYQGGQAQHIRVPNADFNALTLPQARNLRPTLFSLQIFSLPVGNPMS